MLARLACGSCTPLKRLGPAIGEGRQYGAPRIQSESRERGFIYAKSCVEFVVVPSPSYTTVAPEMGAFTFVHPLALHGFRRDFRL